MSRTKVSNNCPVCGCLLDCATPIEKEEAVPSPGDISICLKCTSVLKFDDDLHLSCLSTEEFAGYPKDFKSSVKKARDRIIEYNNQKRGAL